MTFINLVNKIKPIKNDIWRIIMTKDFSKLQRPKYPMPDFIRKALEESGLLNAYKERPSYQQNDYIGWICRAKRQETKEKRLHQMLTELELGGIYMNMDHHASKNE